MPCTPVFKVFQLKNRYRNCAKLIKYEYHDDIIIVEFDKTFELAEGKSINDYVLYVCFVSPSVIKSLIPSGFGEPNAWEL